MSILVSDIRLPVDHEEGDALERARALAGVPAAATVYKKAIDARRGRVSFVYSVRLSCGENEAELVKRLDSPHIRLAPDGEELRVRIGSEKLSGRPVIVGFGPAGMFAGLLLSSLGYRPVILERGGRMEERVSAVDRFFHESRLDENTNIQFGEGGAGTFSDGKLTTRIGDPLCAQVLKVLHENGAPDEILTLARPHVGTDVLRGVVVNIRKRIERLGGEVFFHSRAEDFRLENGRITAVYSEKTGWIDSPAVILALGHSARDTYERLFAMGVAMEQKPFSVGVRIEHLQNEVDRATYGSYAGHKNLPPASYQFSLREGERACYTFCMCPGGQVVASASEEDTVVTNGMSYHKRDMENANSALVVSVGPGDFDGDDPLGGVRFQRELERRAFLLGGGDYSAPLSTVDGFLNGRRRAPGRVQPSFTGNTALTDLNRLLPPVVCEYLKKGLARFGRQMPGFDDPEALLTGVETRTSAPLRILRGEGYESLGVRGLYPCGEGAGYAGGIMSAAVDGLKVARAIAERYAPF